MCNTLCIRFNALHCNGYWHPLATGVLLGDVGGDDDEDGHDDVEEAEE